MVALDRVPVQQFVVLLTFLVAAVALFAIDRPNGRWSAALRRRLVLGVPWGTLVVAVGVTAVYLFVQGGLWHWETPLTIPFRAWSYFYPIGMATAAFAHAGPNHLVANLVGTLVFAPLVEYAWGHYPRRRGTTSFGSWRTDPYVRAFVLFPVATVGVGLLTALFAIGPVIGFSGVVFAYAGFALVHYPLGTVLALAVGRLLQTVYAALRNPTFTATTESIYASPWWADIAIQGHALGLLVGVALGVVALRRGAGTRPDALRVWTGVLLFATWQSLWAVYWFRGGESYVLFRAAGVALVVTLATVVTAAVAASDRPLFGTGSPDESLRSMSRWRVALALVVVAAAAVSGPAVAVNLGKPTGEGVPNDSIDVRGYEVTYAEGVENGMVSVLDVSAFGETTAVTTSGVVVRNADRNIWLTAVTKGRLAFAGAVPIRVGGVAWRETVVVRREGWDVVGGNTSYRIVLSHDGATTPVYASPPAEAAPVIDGRNVSVVARRDGFRLAVAHDDETVRGPLPGKNETVTLDGVTFERRGEDLVATAGRTRIPIAEVETYR